MRCQKWVGGVENLLLALQRIYICYYSNVTLNYEDSMERQDGMNYWCGAVWLGFFFLFFVFCAHNLNPTYERLEVESVKERQSTGPDTDSSHV